MSEKVTVKVERSVLHLPAIALRGLVVFPNNLLHFEVGREKSIAAVEWAVSNNSDVFLVAQKEMKVEEPKSADLYTYGVVAEVKQVMRVSDDLVRILVEGKYRAKLSEMEDDGSFLLATVRPAPVKMAKPEEMPEADVLVRNVKKSFDELLALNPHIGKDVVFAITTSTDPAFLSEYIPANLLFRFEDKQAILDEGTLMGRLRLLIEKKDAPGAPDAGDRQRDRPEGGRSDGQEPARLLPPRAAPHDQRGAGRGRRHHRRSRGVPPEDHRSPSG